MKGLGARFPQDSWLEYDRGDGFYWVPLGALPDTRADDAHALRRTLRTYP